MIAHRSFAAGIRVEDAHAGLVGVPIGEARLLAAAACALLHDLRSDRKNVRIAAARELP